MGFFDNLSKLFKPSSPKRQKKKEVITAEPTRYSFQGLLNEYQQKIEAQGLHSSVQAVMARQQYLSSMQQAMADQRRNQMATWEPITYRGTGDDLNMDNMTRAVENLRDNLMSAVTTPPVEAKKRGRPSKKLGEEAVADVIAQHSSSKTKALKERLKAETAKIESEERQLKTKQQTLSTLVRTKAVLEERYKAMAGKKRAELVENYRTIITKLKLHPLVDKFDVDTQKRVVITTKPIIIKKSTWKKEKVAGIYQIRVDFSKPAISEAIHILNCTQRFDNYDSPTINQTSPCWGNISQDIQNDFNTQDLYELVIDLIDYIASPNDGDGFISHPKAGKAKAWEYWFEKVKKMPEGFNFAKYDQNNKSKSVPGVSVDYYQSVAIDPSVMLASYATPWVVNVSTASSLATPSMPMGVPVYRDPAPRPLNGYQRDLMEQLERELYLKDHSAWHISHLICAEGTLPIRRIELDYRGQREIVMYVTKTRLERVNATNTADLFASEQREQIERYFLNEQDLLPQGLERLHRAGHLSFYVRNPHDFQLNTGQAQREMSRNYLDQLYMGNLTTGNRQQTENSRGVGSLREGSAVNLGSGEVHSLDAPSNEEATSIDLSTTEAALARSLEEQLTTDNPRFEPLNPQASPPPTAIESWGI